MYSGIGDDDDDDSKRQRYVCCQPPEQQRLVVVGESSETRHDDDDDDKNFVRHRSNTALRYTCRHEAILNHIDVQIGPTGGGSGAANTTGSCTRMLLDRSVECESGMMSASTTAATALQSHRHRMATDHEGRRWTIQSQAGAEIAQVYRIRVVRTCRIVDKCVAVVLQE
ncbi:hypothetical protein RP20_CCG021208 [Aedes albopictus]|nr:hypothetical protein RP20_CCG021208 [Aedes albopictus]